MFNPIRLKQARHRRGLTKVALADRVDLTSRRIAAFENEGIEPPPETVKALAAALDFPTAFFAQPGGTEFIPNGVSFRSFSRLSAGDRDAALAGVRLAFEIANWIEERFTLPTSDLPDMRDLPPAQAAAALRSTWALGEAPAPNMIHLAEAHGIRVFSLTDDCAALDAISAWNADRPFIFLTRHKSPERARWDVAHELGHLVLHLGAPPHGRQQEDDADQFAREFLLPERGVRTSATRHPSLQDIRREKVAWRVSALAYIRRLEHLELITKWQYRNLIIEATQAGYKRREGDIDREASQLIPKVLEALSGEGLGVKAIARDLAMPTNELLGLLFSPIAVLDGQRQKSPLARADLRPV